VGSGLTSDLLAAVCAVLIYPHESIAPYLHVVVLCAVLEIIFNPDLFDSNIITNVTTKLSLFLQNKMKTPNWVLLPVINLKHTS
jgi:hypothetical protein